MITRRTLIEAVYHRLNGALTVVDSRLLVNTILNVLVRGLERGESVTIQGLGRLTPYMTRKRKRFDINKKKCVDEVPQFKVKFKQSSLLNKSRSK